MGRYRPGTTYAKADNPQPERVAENYCPTCKVSGDDPCVTPSGKVKDEWHTKRSS